MKKYEKEEIVQWFQQIHKRERERERKMRVTVIEECRKLNMHKTTSFWTPERYCHVR